MSRSMAKIKANSGHKIYMHGENLANTNDSKSLSDIFAWRGPTTLENTRSTGEEMAVTARMQVFNSLMSQGQGPPSRPRLRPRTLLLALRTRTNITDCSMIVSTACSFRWYWWSGGFTGRRLGRRGTDVQLLVGRLVDAHCICMTAVWSRIDLVNLIGKYLRVPLVTTWWSHAQRWTYTKQYWLNLSATHAYIFFLTGASKK